MAHRWRFGKGKVAVAPPRGLDGRSGGLLRAAALHVECLDEAGDVARLTHGIHQPRAADHWKDSAGGAGVQLCVRLVDPERPQDGGEIVKWRQTRLLFLHVVPLSLNVKRQGHTHGVLIFNQRIGILRPPKTQTASTATRSHAYGVCPWFRTASPLSPFWSPNFRGGAGISLPEF